MIKAFLFNREWCGCNICGCGCMSWFEIFMGLLALSHSGLLAITVWTDRIFSGRSGLKGGCITPIRCELCGLPIRICRCVAGVDY